MKDSPDAVISAELGPSERIVWSGKPGRGIRLRGADVFAIPFSLMWCGFAVFWETMAVMGRAPLFFALWGIPFVAIGLYIVFGRFFVDAMVRSKTFYGVTSERILIITAAPKRSFFLRD